MGSLMLVETSRTSLVRRSCRLSLSLLTLKPARSQRAMPVSPLRSWAQMMAPPSSAPSMNSCLWEDADGFSGAWCECEVSDSSSKTRSCQASGEILFSHKYYDGDRYVSGTLVTCGALP